MPRKRKQVGSLVTPGRPTVIRREGDSAMMQRRDALMKQATASRQQGRRDALMKDATQRRDTARAGSRSFPNRVIMSQRHRRRAAK